MHIQNTHTQIYIYIYITAVFKSTSLALWGCRHAASKAKPAGQRQWDGIKKPNLFQRMNDIHKISNRNSCPRSQWAPSVGLWPWEPQPRNSQARCPVPWPTSHWWDSRCLEGVRNRQCETEKEKLFQIHETISLSLSLSLPPSIAKYIYIYIII